MMRLLLGTLDMYRHRAGLFCTIVWRVWEPGFRISPALAWNVARTVYDVPWDFSTCRPISTPHADPGTQPDGMSPATQNADGPRDASTV